jgi:NitT/TauT family transport system substrate-binding protein
VPIRFAIPDMISPSYFPLIAAVTLGHVAEETGEEATIELSFPVTVMYERLRDGEFEHVGGAAHAALHAFPDWDGCQLLAALSQGMYWFLVVRSELVTGAPGDLGVLRGLRIGAAPGPVDGLRHVLRSVGIDPDTDVAIGPVAPAEGAGASFGVSAARALADGSIDAFWANGMGAELAVREGVGHVVLDARRGPRPDGTTDFTFPALITTSRRAADSPAEVAGVVRALHRAQRDLRADPALATRAARDLFPEMERSLIAGLVARDAEFYSPEVTDRTFLAMHHAAHAAGLTGHATPTIDPRPHGPVTH